MKFNFNEDRLKQGIYISINTHSNRIYVGKTTINFQERWNEHVRLLLQQKHFNKFLQNDYDKCKNELDHDDFLEFHVLEIMENFTQEEINKKEEFYILSIFDKQKYCYNFKKRINEKERSCYSKTPKETKKKQSENSKKMWNDPVWKEKQISVITIGKNKPKSIQINSQNVKKLWQNEEYREKNLKSRKPKKNFRHSKETIEKMSKTKRKNLGKIISPTGEVFEVIGAKTFCIEHNIPLSSVGNISSLLSGKMLSVHGWRKYKE